MTRRHDRRRSTARRPPRAAVFACGDAHADPVQQAVRRAVPVHRSQRSAASARSPNSSARRTSIRPAGSISIREGLLVLTDDGALAHRLTDPRHKLAKTYLVQVEGTPDASALRATCAPASCSTMDRRCPPTSNRSTARRDWLWPRDPPVRFRKSVAGCVAAPDDPRRPQPPGAPHDRGGRTADAAPDPRARRRVRARRSRARREPRSRRVSARPGASSKRARIGQLVQRALDYHCAHGVPGSFLRSRDDLPRSAPALSGRAVRLARAQAPARDLVWDAGCGNGQASVALAARFARVFATDPSANQIANAEATAEHRISRRARRAMLAARRERRSRHRRAGAALVRSSRASSPKPRAC